MKRYIRILFCICLITIGFTACGRKNAIDPETVLFIEAEDPFHETLGAFYVGEPFTTYEKTEDGVERGVTLWFHFRSEEHPIEGFFTNASQVKDAVFDTTECELGENGCFTKAGNFSVKVSWLDFTAEYTICVEEQTGVSQ